MFTWKQLARLGLAILVMALMLTILVEMTKRQVSDYLKDNDVKVKVEVSNTKPSATAKP
jgi:hypothetical protein